MGQDIICNTGEAGGLAIRAELSEEARAFAKASIAPNTRRAYAA